MKTGTDVKEGSLKFECGAYHHVGAGIVPGRIELLHGTLEPAKVLRRAPRAGVVNDRHLVFA